LRPVSDDALSGVPVVGVNPNVNSEANPNVNPEANPNVNPGANRAVRGSSPVSAIPLVLMENGVAMDTPERVTMSRSLSFGESEVGNPAQPRLGSDGSARAVVAAYGSGFAGFSGAASGRSPFPVQVAPIGAIDSNREISQRMPVPAPAADGGEIAPVLVGSVTSLVDHAPAQNSVAGESVMPVNLDESRPVPRSAKNAARLESVAISGKNEISSGVPVVGVNPNVNPEANPNVNPGANRAVRGSSPVSAIPLVLMENGVAMDTPERVTMSRSLSFGESEVGNPAQPRLGSDGSARAVVAAYGSGFAGFSGAASGRSPFPVQVAPIGAIDSNREISQRMPVPAPAADGGEIAPVLVGSVTSLVDHAPAQNSVAGESVMPVNLDESRLVPRSAKNAARLESVAISGKNEISNFNKTLLNVDIDVFNGLDKPAGIDVAKTEVIMAASAHSQSDFGPVLDLLPTWPMAAVSGRNHDFSQVETEVTAPAEAAHRAVEAILSAVERFAGAERHSVNLDFSIAGHELSVRVELRADEVRATFCTNSPELRAALAQEWQAVSGGNAREGSVKLGAPIFTANASVGEPSAASSFSGGEGFAQKKHSDTRQADAELLRVGAASLVRRPQSLSTNSASAMINAVVPNLASAVSSAVTPSSAHRFWAHA
jgi:hypothetical protein